MHTAEDEWGCGCMMVHELNMQLRCVQMEMTLHDGAWAESAVGDARLIGADSSVWW